LNCGKAIETGQLHLRKPASIFWVEDASEQNWLLGLHFNPLDGGKMFLRNVGVLLPVYTTTSHPR
jgi:hypothetical protein